MKFTIDRPEQFNYRECLRFLNRISNECLFKVQDEDVYSSILIDQQAIPFKVAINEKALVIDTLPDIDIALKEAVKKHIYDWFDLGRNLSPFYKLIAKDSRLTKLLMFKGLRMMGIPDLFEALCWSIIGQQINLEFAFKLKKRLVENYGFKVEYDGHEFWHFPTPTRLLQLNEEFQKANQFSRSKVKYLKNVSEAFESGRVSKQKLLELNSFQERQTLLTSIKGIGEWSANYALMKCLHEPNAIPFGDTGLSQALFNLGIITDRKDRQQIEDFFRKFEGWEGYTTFYLWHSLLK